MGRNQHKLLPNIYAKWAFRPNFLILRFLNFQCLNEENNDYSDWFG